MLSLKQETSYDSYFDNHSQYIFEKHSVKYLHKLMHNIMFQDTQWVDIDYMDSYKDWTLDPNNFNDLPNLVNDLHSYGMHFIPIVVRIIFLFCMGFFLCFSLLFCFCLFSSKFLAMATLTFTLPMFQCLKMFQKIRINVDWTKLKASYEYKMSQIG